LLKWNLWHGNVSPALKRIEELQLDFNNTYAESENRTNLRRALREFEIYVERNRGIAAHFGFRSCGTLRQSISIPK